MRRRLDIFEKDCDYLVESDLKKGRILITRSGATADKIFDISVEKTVNDSDYDVLLSITIDKRDNREERLSHITKILNMYVKKGGSEESLVSAAS